MAQGDRSVTMYKNGDRGIRLVASSDWQMPLEFELALELSTNRLREALAILRVIDDGEFLSEVQAGDAGAQQKLVVSLLAVLARELDAIISAQDELLRDTESVGAPRG
jgi:hypothetical protein